MTVYYAKAAVTVNLNIKFRLGADDLQDVIREHGSALPYIQTVALKVSPESISDSEEGLPSMYCCTIRDVPSTIDALLAEMTVLKNVEWIVCLGNLADHDHRQPLGNARLLRPTSGKAAPYTATLSALLRDSISPTGHPPIRLTLNQNAITKVFENCVRVLHRFNINHHKFRPGKTTFEDLPFAHGDLHTAHANTIPLSARLVDEIVHLMVLHLKAHPYLRFFLHYPTLRTLHIRLPPNSFARIRGHPQWRSILTPWTYVHLLTDLLKLVFTKMEDFEVSGCVCGAHR
jgi:hypothetical protein